MEKLEYKSPVTRSRQLMVEYPVMSPLPGGGENANPYEEDWD